MPVQILILLFLLILGGCARVDKQAASDGVAGSQATKILIDQERLTEAKQVVDAAIAYQLAAINTPYSELPAPKIPAVKIAEAPQSYIAAAPPEPVSAGFWALLGTGGLAVLWGLGRVAPALPGVGPMVGSLATMAWNILSTSHQKKADSVAATTTDAATKVVPVLEWIAMNREALPDTIKDKIDIKTLDALTTIVATLAKKS